MSSLVAGRHQAFQQRLNTLTGESEWVVIDEKDDDDVGETALSASRSFLSVTSYLDMLNDSRRNVAFRLAIEKTITDPCHVLDIGAGTGLLSMMAARAMMESAARGEAKVSACESYLPMGKLMRKILRANGMESMVKLFHKRSDELQVGVDLDCRASVLVSEILDSELLGEGLIPTLQHAHDMLLTSNAKTIPYHATTYGQLSEPFKIFEFDFWKRPDSHGETEMWINPTDDGKVHAVVTWWVLQLDREGSVLYSTAPSWIGSSKNEGVDCWRDHWKQCVWFIPGEGISVSRDTNILFKAVHDVTNISYFLGGDKNMTYSSFNSHDSHLCLSPERIGIYGEKDIRSAFLIAVKNALQRIRVHPLCVVADDSILLTILAGSLSDSSKIISSFHGFQGKGCAYIQALSVANGFSMDRVQVLNKRIASLLLDGTPWKVDLFLAEPFYHKNEGMLPWQNLKFWRDRSLLDPILSKDAIVLPCKGILKVCAMYLPDLWKSRCCLQEIEGFDHSIANETLGAYGNWPPSLKGTCLPFFIWQCGEIKELSDVFSIMDFNFSKPLHDCYGNIRIEFSEPGICHGLVLWIDWVLDVDNSIIISTGPVNRYWKQGVKLLSTPLKVDVGSSVEIEASFDAASGELTLESLIPP
ncbi:hypothetical protein KFK09_001707 [Dendrobium nobile]|uniref:Protein arginine N-methyltransferase domain-containing protein n=1 Tax=Dendrobium nobile TaxID=94219 RepID=A0A8T3C5Q4_DENNO|nr:hypothetical protein KFK09_001707 [Dendrobium nobile]